MNFSLSKSLEILDRTPDVLSTMLGNLSVEWTHSNEGEGTWSVYDIVGHLIHGEKTDWMPRVEIILSGAEPKNFAVFDRWAQFEESKGKDLPALLEEFTTLRRENLARLLSKNLVEADGVKTGVHPAFGEVSLSQLLATWTVHDLNHLAQIARVMAFQYKAAAGPWVAYLKILQ